MATKKTKKTQKLDDQPGQPDPKAPLDSGLLLRAAQPLLKALAEDLLERARQSAAVAAALRGGGAECSKTQPNRPDKVDHDFAVGGDMSPRFQRAGFRFRNGEIVHAACHSQVV